MGKGIIEPGNLICVTGASGYIAGYIIEQLLAKQYRVRGVVRDIKREEKYSHLKSLPQKPGQLEIVEADISAGQYDEILKGCDGLIHTATPYIYTAPDPQKDIVEPAVKGTVDAINAALKNNLKRVVVTSSGGAIFRPNVEAGYTFGEKDWNTFSSLTNNPYFYSKRLAEEAAWELWEKHKQEIDIAVVNPVFVCGPPKSPILNSSITLVKKHLMGEMPAIQPGYAAFVHVRDAATAHVIALENSKAVGRRLIACATTTSWKRMADTLKRLFPKYPVTQDAEEKGSPFYIDNSLSKELGLTEYIPLETALQETVESLVRLGVVSDL